MNKRCIDYQEELIKSLQDPEEALAYLNAAFADKDPRIFLLAIKNVLEAQNRSTIDLTKVIKLTTKNISETSSMTMMPKYFMAKSLD
jgi:DNA-binding phage protein